jgi:hypothetical protein
MEAIPSKLALVAASGTQDSHQRRIGDHPCDLALARADARDFRTVSAARSLFFAAETGTGLFLTCFNTRPILTL